MLTISRYCQVCNKETLLQLNDEQASRYYKWKYDPGALIQDCLPDLDVYQREFLITSICKECQEEIFADWEDEEND